MSSLDLSNPALALSFLPTSLSVIQLLPSQTVPQALLTALAGTDDAGEGPAFISLTRTPTEKSIILPTALFEQLYPPSVGFPHFSPPPSTIDRLFTVHRQASRDLRPLERPNRRRTTRLVAFGDSSRAHSPAQGGERSHLRLVDMGYRLRPDQRGE